MYIYIYIYTHTLSHMTDMTKYFKQTFLGLFVTVHRSFINVRSDSARYKSKLKNTYGIKEKNFKGKI